jgi:hypothetical protein
MKKGKPVTIWLDEETIKRLDRVKATVGISRSRMVENLLLVGLDSADTLRKIGILPIAVLFRDIGEGIKKRLAEVERITGESA